MAVVMRPMVSEKRWESFISKNAPQALFQSWAWGETQEKLHTRVFRFGFYSGSTLIGIAQVVRVPARRGTFLHVRHGPVLIDYSSKTLRSIIKPLTALAMRERAWFIRMSPLLEPSDALQVRV